MQYVHGGDIYSYAEQFAGREVLDFSSNINPRGIPEPVRQAMRDAVDQCEHYPDPFCRGLTEGLEKNMGFRRGCSSAQTAQRISFSVWRTCCGRGVRC